MSYVNKRLRVFLDLDYKEPTKIRSECRMKNYISTTDARAWCDIIEERRQHILEYLARGRTGLCPGHLIPMEAIIAAMMGDKENEIKEMQKKVEYYEKLIQIYESLDLTAEQKAKLESMKKELEDEECKGPCATAAAAQDEICQAPCADGQDGQQGQKKDVCDKSCSCDDLPEDVCKGPCANDSKGVQAKLPTSKDEEVCKCDQHPKNSPKPYVCKGPCSKS